MDKFSSSAIGLGIGTQKMRAWTINIPSKQSPWFSLEFDQEDAIVLPHEIHQDGIQELEA